MNTTSILDIRVVDEESMYGKNCDDDIVEMYNFVINNKVLCVCFITVYIYMCACACSVVIN